MYYPNINACYAFENAYWFFIRKGDMGPEFSDGVVIAGKELTALDPVEYIIKCRPENVVRELDFLSGKATPFRYSYYRGPGFLGRTPHRYGPDGKIGHFFESNE